MGVFHYEKDDDGIVVVTMDMTGPVNAINAEYNDAMEQTVCKLESETDLTGVVFASAKTVFFAGCFWVNVWFGEFMGICLNSLPWHCYFKPFHK